VRTSVLKRLMEIPDEHLRGVLLDVVGELEQEIATREMLSALRVEFQEAEKRGEERFNRLERALAELAEAQKRTEERVEQLSEAQKRTEEALRALAEAQRRTEERLNHLAEAQRRSEERLDRLEQVVAELAEAQKRSEERLNRLEETVEKLAEAQRRTEEQVQRLVQELGTLKDTVRGMKGEREGERYEQDMVQSAPRLLGMGRGGSPKTYEVQRMLMEMIGVPDASDSEEDPYLADLIWQKGPVVLVVEISIAVDGKDVLRAWKRAETLKRAGLEARAVVMGERWATEETKMLAREKNVAWYVEKEFSPDLMEIRKIP